MTPQDKQALENQPTDREIAPVMRELTTDELRAIVGGPEIQNGGTPPG